VGNVGYFGLAGDEIFMDLRSLFARIIAYSIKASILWIAYYKIMKEAKLGKYSCSGIGN